jgi:glycosyltransferase involved in cell wall biosynthesis
MSPQVSVLIPTYNRRDLVLEALQTVIGQSYRPIEVIVVDDASMDETVECLRAMDFPIRVEVLALPTNRGPSGARNAGLQTARGTYVAFLDSDDWWLPEKLERQVAELERHPNPGKALIYSQVHLVRSHERLLRPVRAKCDGEPLADYLFVKAGHLNSSNIVLATELARQIAYREDLRLHEDWDFYLRLEEAGIDFVMIPEVLSGSNDSDRDDRASKPQLSLALAWLAIWQPKISRSAYLALRAKLAPHLRAQDSLLGLRFIVEAYLSRAIDIRYLLFLCGALVHPAMRTLVSRVRGSLQRTSYVDRR